MTKLMKNYQLFTFWWFKSLYPALTNMSRLWVYDKGSCSHDLLLKVHKTVKIVYQVNDGYKGQKINTNHRVV